MLKRVHIQNYKSLRDVKLTFDQPINVFVGPNNSGKSNLLDALRFLHELVTEGEPALQRRGGYEAIVWHGQTDLAITFEVTSQIPTDNGARDFTYHVSIQHFSPPSEEWLQISDEPKWQFEFKWEYYRAFRGGEELHVPFIVVYKRYLYDEAAPLETVYSCEILTDKRILERPALGFTLRAKTAFSTFADWFSHWSFHRFEPSRLRSPCEVKEVRRLSYDGNNLAAVLHTLYLERAEVLTSLTEDMKAAVKEITGIFVKLTDEQPPRVGVWLKEGEMSVPATNASDGTLHLLALLTLLELRDELTVVGIEEPENYIHPHLLAQVEGILRGLATNGTVLITTHSPLFLDKFEPDEVHIVERRDGETIVQRAVDRRDIERVRKDLGMAALWYEGHLGGVP